MDSVLTILLAGGKGTRLDPLTRDRAKPAVPFGGMYRIVDFALSNCLNSRQMRILVLTQYKSLSLEQHVSLGWGRFFHPEFGQWLAVASPQQRVSEDWYLGTADAVYQNIYSIERSGAEYLLVLAGDHVYKMDYRRLLAFHQDHGGVATVATVPCPLAAASRQFGAGRAAPRRPPAQHLRQRYGGRGLAERGGRRVRLPDRPRGGRGGQHPVRRHVRRPRGPGPAGDPRQGGSGRPGGQGRLRPG